MSDVDDGPDPDEALRVSIDGLRERHPWASASVSLTRGQQRLAVVVAVVFALAAVVATRPVAIGLSFTAMAIYLWSFAERILLFHRGLEVRERSVVSDQEARAIPDDELPVYTVLVPAYGEPEVVGRLVGHIAALEYPPDKLDVKLLLEADDAPTIAAARAAEVASHRFHTILVPPSEPRTKPKACNFGLQYARGTYVTIYDAEDEPEPLQLRRAVAAFRRASPDTACLQAQLAYHNAGQNLLTGWFAAEYLLWFRFILPGLEAVGGLLPLGGTSNHLRRDVLEEIGAWDPFNVTEDADLGARIASAGYRTGVLASATLEEANSDPINWIRQRSRWHKGYLQTTLVHLRRPRQLVRALGLYNVARFALLVAGTPILAVLNAVFWLIAIAWSLGQLAVIGELFPWYVLYPSVLCLVLGNASAIYLGLAACYADGRDELLVPALTVPLYWVMMTVAALKGSWQLVTSPSYWEKTVHGLDTVPSDP